MSGIPMQQWYPDAHLSDTADLTLEEQGAYRLLIDHMWVRGSVLENDDKRIARLLRISVRRWRRIKLVLKSYLVIECGIITHKRVQRDYKLATEKSKRNKINGQKGGFKTAENFKTVQANALATKLGDLL